MPSLHAPNKMQLTLDQTLLECVTFQEGEAILGEDMNYVMVSELGKSDLKGRINRKLNSKTQIFNTEI